MEEMKGKSGYWEKGKKQIQYDIMQECVTKKAKENFKRPVYGCSVPKNVSEEEKQIWLNINQK